MIYQLMTDILLSILRIFGSRNSISILNYHRVMPQTNICSAHALPPEHFAEHLRWLKRYFKVLPLPEALKLAAQNQLPKNTVVITVDDGFADSYDYVFPLLQQYGMTATFFISTAGLEQGYLWENEIAESIRQAPDNILTIKLEDLNVDISTQQTRDTAILILTELIKYQSMQQRNLSINLLMAQTGKPRMDYQFVSRNQLLEMHQAGMTIGAHTVNHPILARESIETASLEIDQSKADLEAIIGTDVDYFAYPNGKYLTDFTDEHIKLVRNLGFRAAFCTDWGVAHAEADSHNMYCLKRFTPWDRHPALFCLRLALNSLAERSFFRVFRVFVRKNNS